MNHTITLFNGLRPNHLFALALVSFLGFSSQHLGAQNVSVNPGAGSYPTLADAFAAINAGTHTGAVTVSIVGNTTETVSAVLNASGTGAASYTSVLITPGGGAPRTVSGNIGTNLIDLDGADNVTIDGLNTGGNALTISNTATGGANTLRFINDASNNTISNTRLEGSASTLQFGVVNIGTGTTTGNDNNTFSNCDITAAGTNLPINGIFSLGSANIDNSGITVTGCRIFDFFNAASTSIGIHINATNALSSSAWTITNNKLYQTGIRRYTTANTHQAIFVGLGSGYTITGNTIGFADANGSGLYRMIGNSVDLAGFPDSYTPSGTANATRFIAIGAAFTAGGTNSVIQNNTVAGIALYTSSGATTTNGIVCGVNVTTGNTTISNNTIGATSGTGSIYTVCTTSGGVVVGIYAAGANTHTIQNNTVGAIDAMGSTAANSGGITGINSGGTAVVNLSNNTVGNATNPNLRMGNLFNGGNLSNNGTFSIATGLGDFKGIINQSSGLVTISNNIVRNASLNSSSASSDFRGIEMTSGNYNVNNNTITALTTASANATVATALLAGVGILGQGGTAGSVITQNTINGLSLSNTGTAGTNVTGVGISNIPIDVTRNKIWDLRNASTSVSLTAPGSASGVFIRSATAGGNVNIVNNMITLGTDQATSTAFIGIWSNHGSSPNPNVNVYHNSVRIEGAAGGGTIPTFGFHRGNFATAVVNQVLVDIRNNIFDNTRTGGGPNCAIGNYFNATTTSGVNWGPNASNFNVLNSADAATVGYWQTAQTFAGWQAAAVSDINSISGTAINFVDPATGDLHISTASATPIEGAGTLVASVTLDFDGQTRTGFTPVDIGSDAGNFVALDVSAPAISYTPILNSICTTPVTLSATITDATGVNTAAGTKPRLWFKKASEDNVLPATNTSADNGWKFVEASNSSSPFTFTPNYNLLTSPVASGDVLNYFVVAQDVLAPPLVGTNQALYPAGFTPASVALAAGAFPVSSFRTYNILASPVTITASAAPSALCISGNVVLNLSGDPVTGAEYQWQSSPAGANTWTTIAGATTVPYTVVGVSTSTDYRCIISCGGVPIAASPSTVAAVTVSSPAITSTTPGTECGPGPIPVTLGATASSGALINWYDVPTGGVPVGTGTSFTTPPISVTTNYYVAANDGGGSANLGLPAALPTATSGAGTTNFGLVFDAISTFTLQKVTMYPVAAAANTAGTVTVDIVDGNGVILHSKVVDVLGNPAASPVAQTVTLDFVVQPGTNLKLRPGARSASITGILFEPSASAPNGNYGYPFTIPGVVTILHSTLTAPPANTPRLDLYYYFYNWEVSTGCETPRQAVTATIINDAPTCPANSAVCINAAPFTLTGATPTGGVYSGNGVTNGVFSPAAAGVGIHTITYTLCGQNCTFTITVNALPVAAISAAENSGAAVNDGIICTGASVTLTATGGGTYLWSNNSTSDAITVSPTATTTYTVTVTTNGCIGTASFTVVVNNFPTASIAPATSTICSGASVTLTASGGGTYAWTTTQTTAAITVSPTATTTYTVTVTTTGCSSTASATVNVNPTPGLSSTQIQPTTCISADGSIDLTVTGTGTFTYNWAGMGSQQGQQDQANLAVGTYLVTVTNSGTGCTSTLSIALPGPGGCDVCPTISTLNAPTGVCNGSAAALSVTGLADMGVTFGIQFKYSTTALANPYTGGTVIATIPNSGLGGGGTTAATSFTFPAIGSYFVYAILSPSPTDPLCRPFKSAGLGVNPIPSVNAVTNKVHCPGNSVATIAFSGSPAGTVFNWSRTGEAIGLAATSGTGNVPAFTAANAGNAPLVSTFTVTPTFTANGVTCSGTPTTFTITVNPTPTVEDPANQVVCNTASTAAVNFVGTVAGTVFNWTNNTPSIGLAASGSGNIAAFTATNAGNTPVTATVTVTPSYTNAGITCTGTAQTFTIVVNPTPTANAVASQTRCNGTATAAVNFSGAVSGTVFNWTNDQPSIGLAASGTGNIASFTATNTGNAPVVATIVVTPSYTNAGTTCTGAPQTFTITVNPIPNANAVANQVFCSGIATAPINFTGAVAGTVYNWTNSNTAIGLAASGSGTSIPSFTATNSGGTSIVGTITVTPTFTGGAVACTGGAITFTITVSPTPNVAAVANQLLCSESTTTAVAFTGTVPNTVFNWTNNTPAIGLAASGTGNIAAFVAQNPGTTPLVATITVTPAFTDGPTTCFGTPRTFTITVNPLPKVNVGADQVICQNQSANLNAVLSGGAFSGTWNGGAGTYGNQTAASTTYTPAASEYGQTITLIFTTNDPAGPCPSASDALTLTINTLPIVNAGEDFLICEGDNLTLLDLGASITENGSGVTTGVWSSTGTGTFQPNANFPSALTYTPSAADIAAGYVLLRLTSDDPAGPCGTVSDEVRLGFHEEKAFSCNDLVNVSLDADCVGEVLPDDVLEGDADDYKFYTVKLYTNTNVPLPGGNVVGVADLGKTYKVKVTDICTNNFCWGNIKVEDKLPPTMTCADVTLICAVTNFTPAYITNTLGIAAGTPTVTDCSATTLTYDDVWTDLPCTGSINGKTNVSAFIKRDWVVKDAWNNFSVCTQYIYLERRGITTVQFPTDVDLVCTNVNTTPSSTGAPFVTALGQNWPLFPDQASCELSVGYTDQTLPVCGGSYKILRTWTVYDWCLPTNPGPTGTLNPRYFIQVIKVTDNQGPTIACPTNITVSTNSYNCCANADLPDVILADNCNRVASLKATVEGVDPLTNVPFSYEITGSLTTFDGNNLWNPDTLGVMGLTPCLPMGTYPVRYIAEDLCGNQRTCSFNITVADRVPPTVACDQYTIASLGPDGTTEVLALTFDDGSFDNCGPVTFGAGRSSGSNGQTVTFSCSDIGKTITIFLLVTDQAGNTNECMVPVHVDDKLKPLCVAPANTTVSCENFDPSLWAYGQVTAEDNCCIDSTSTVANYSQFDTLCSRGTITRTFRVFDCGGNTQQCTQRILVNYEQDYFVRFPDDRLVTTCDGTGNFGEPTFLNKDCELLGVSFTDEIFTVVPDACYKIERTWHVINWCRYNANVPLTAVPNPNPNATVNSPANNAGPVISASSNPSVLAAPWTATRVAITPGAAQTDYSVFYLGGTYVVGGQTLTAPNISNSNGFSYKQIIKVADTQDPTIDNCPTDPLTFCDLTPNDGQLWNESYWYDNGTMSHDLCEGPVDLSITATDACSGSVINIKYLLFLDTDNNGSMETVISSTNLPGFNNVNFNNANNLNFTGGTPQAFDGRPVPSNQKYGFALQTTTSGTKRTASVRWNTFQAQNTYVVPELPYGTHKIKWIVEDGCGNEAICEYTFVVKDCKAPTVVCINGLSVNIMPTNMIQLWASDFLQYTEDNCTPTSKLQIAIRRVGAADGQGNTTGFPRNADGTPQTSVAFTCNDLGQKEVELWSIDLAGNADFCVTYVIVQDNNNNCGTDAAVVAGFLKTEEQKGLEEADVELAGGVTGAPSFLKTLMTDQDGHYQSTKSVPLGANFTVTPTHDANPLNGVSTYDLVLISKHILGLEPLPTPYKMIAADANKSGSITTFDIVELRKLILGIYTELPNNTSWRFVDKGFAFPDVLNPFKTAFPENKTVADIQASMLGGDFVAMKVGDVNGSATANSLTSSEDRTSGTLLLDVSSPAPAFPSGEGDRTVKAGETFEVTFKAADAMQGFQFTLQLNGLTVADIVETGKVTADNFGVHADALTVSIDGAQEFTVKFRAAKSGRLSQMLGVSSRITKAEAYTLHNERQEVALRFGATTVGIGFELYQNQPNPFVNKTFIGFHLPEAATATLTVYDETGRTLFAQKGDYAKGYNSVAVDAAALQGSGVLYYKLETATDSATKQMVQVK